MVHAIPKNEKSMLTIIDQTEFSYFFSHANYSPAKTTDLASLYAISDNILFANGLSTAPGIVEQAVTNHPNLLQLAPQAAHDKDDAVALQPEATADALLCIAEWDEVEIDLERAIWQLDDLKSSATDNNTPSATEDDIIPPIFKASALRAMQPTPGDNDVNLAIEYFKENDSVASKTEDEAKADEATLPSLTTTINNDSVADSTQLIENYPINFPSIASTANPVIDNDDNMQNTDTDTTAEWSGTDSTTTLETVIVDDTSINDKPILSLLPDKLLTGYLPEPTVLTKIPQIAVCFMPMFNAQDLIDATPVDEAITKPETLQLIGQSFETIQII